MINGINQIAQSWWSWIGPILLQVSVLIGIVGILDFFLKKWAWPQFRYALWLLVLIKLLIPPTWSMPSSILPGIQAQALAALQKMSGISECQDPVHSHPHKTDPASPALASGAGRETDHSSMVSSASSQDSKATSAGAPFKMSGKEDVDQPDTGEEAIFATDVVREKTYFLWKLTDSKVMEMNDAWIQDNRMAYVQPDKDRTLLVDSEKMLFTYIDHKDGPGD